MIVRAVFYALVMTLFPLGLQVSKGMERVLAACFMFTYAAFAATQLTQTPCWLLVLGLVVPALMTVVMRIAHDLITRQERRNGIQARQ